MLSRLLLRLRLAVEDWDRKGCGTLREIGRRVIMLTGGDDLALSRAFAVCARRGLGGAGEGRLRGGGDFIEMGDLISKRRIAASLTVKVRLTICGERRSSLLVIAMKALS